MHHAQSRLKANGLDGDEHLRLSRETGAECTYGTMGAERLCRSAESRELHRRDGENDKIYSIEMYAVDGGKQGLDEYSHSYGLDVG